MARGFDAVRKASADIADRKNTGGDFKNLLKLPKHNDTAVVRFLEEGDEVVWAWVHERRTPGRRPITVPCLDQDETGAPCPGCESPADEIRKRKFKGWVNVVHYDAPKLKRDEAGRGVKENGQWVFDGVEDRISIWEQGITVFEDLADKDVTYRGLTSRPFRITRKGIELNTKYSIDPADPDAGKVDPSEDEQKLIAEKYDLSEFTRVPEYDEAAELLGGQAGGGVTPQAVAQSSSPFDKGGETRASRFLEG